MAPGETTSCAATLTSVRIKAGTRGLQGPGAGAVRGRPWARVARGGYSGWRRSAKAQTMASGPTTVGNRRSSVLDRLIASSIVPFWVVIETLR